MVRVLRFFRSPVSLVMLVVFVGSLLVAVPRFESGAQSTVVDCGLCVMAPAGTSTVLSGLASLTVSGGGVGVESNGAPALSLAGSAKIVASGPVRTRGTISRAGSATITPAPAFGVVGSVVVDPYSARAGVVEQSTSSATTDFVKTATAVFPARVDAAYRDVSLTSVGTFVFPTGHRFRDVTVGGSTFVTLRPGTFRNLNVGGASTVTFDPGLYVVTGVLTVGSSFAMSGTGVQLVFPCGAATGVVRACNTGELGGRLLVTGNGKITLNGANPTGSVRYTVNNNADLIVQGSGKLLLPGSGIDAPNGTLRGSGLTLISVGDRVVTWSVSFIGSAVLAIAIPTVTSTSTTTAVPATSTTTTKTTKTTSTTSPTTATSTTTTAPTTTTTSTTTIAPTTTTTTTTTVPTTTVPTTTTTSTIVSTTTTVPLTTTTTSTTTTVPTTTSTSTTVTTVPSTTTTSTTVPSTTTTSTTVPSTTTSSTTVPLTTTSSTTTTVAPTSTTTTTAPPVLLSPVFSVTVIPPGTVGGLYSYVLVATGSPAAMAYSFVDPATVPAWLALSPTTGELRGTPSLPGTFTFDVKASNGVLPNATRQVTILVSAAPLAPVFETDPGLAEGVLGLSYTQTVVATGVPSDVKYSLLVGSVLPSGLTLAANGVLSGTPSEPGTFSFTIAASNGTIPNGSRIFTVRIQSPSTTTSSTPTSTTTTSTTTTVPANVCTGEDLDCGVPELDRCLEPGAIVGTAAADVLVGTETDDVICGRGGADQITGLGGNDVILGGAGNDVVDSGPGEDLVLGGDGQDWISGGLGDDQLYGDAGADTINGGAGVDRLEGGAGDDLLDGGLGDDNLHGAEGLDAESPVAVAGDSCVEVETRVGCVDTSALSVFAPATSITKTLDGSPGFSLVIESSGVLTAGDVSVAPMVLPSGDANVIAGAAVEVTINGPQDFITSAIVRLPIADGFATDQVGVFTKTEGGTWAQVTQDIILDGRTFVVRPKHFSPLFVAALPDARQYVAGWLPVVPSQAVCVPALYGAAVSATIISDSSGSSSVLSTEIENTAYDVEYQLWYRHVYRTRNVGTEGADILEDGLGSFGSSDWKPSVLAALDGFIPADRLRLIYLIGDGELDDSSTDIESLIQASVEKRVAISYILVGPNASTPSPLLTRLAQETGGRVGYPSTFATSLVDRFFDTNVDTDKDGLTDCEETNGVRLYDSRALSSVGQWINLPSNPNKIDDDDDGLVDGAEYRDHALGTDANAFRSSLYVLRAPRYLYSRADFKDSDGDGYSDSVESALGRNPLDSKRGLEFYNFLPAGSPALSLVTDALVDRYVAKGWLLEEWRNESKQAVLSYLIYQSAIRIDGAPAGAVARLDQVPLLSRLAYFVGKATPIDPGYVKELTSLSDAQKAKYFGVTANSRDLLDYSLKVIGRYNFAGNALVLFGTAVQEGLKFWMFGLIGKTLFTAFEGVPVVASIRSALASKSAAVITLTSTAGSLYCSIATGCSPEIRNGFDVVSQVFGVLHGAASLSAIKSKVLNSNLLPELAADFPRTKFELNAGKVEVNINLAERDSRGLTNAERIAGDLAPVSDGAPIVNARAADGTVIESPITVNGAPTKPNLNLTAENLAADQTSIRTRAKEVLTTNTPCASFRADTLVLMADGSKKPISEIEVGDKVLATDPATGKTSVRTVTRLFTHIDDDLLDLVVLTDDGVETIHTTDHHRFWNDTRKAWVEAKGLTSGERLLTSDGDVVTVGELKRVPGAAPMLDLTVEYDHTFYVVLENTAVLVHNQTCGLVEYGSTDLSRSVQDARVTAGNRANNYAAARLEDGTIITARSSAGVHAEEALINQAGGKRIIELYSERAPCAAKCAGLTKDISTSWSWEWNGVDRGVVNAQIKSAVSKLFGGN